MNREYHRWYSHNLGCDAELLVFGHAGPKLLVFPTFKGRFYTYEDRGMVEVLRGRLEEGTLQLYCVDGFDERSFYNDAVPPHERILRHIGFERYVLDELLPLVGRNPHPSLATHGCSLGAYHAMNLALRHPSLFSGVLAFSGRYDLSRGYPGVRDVFDGYHDENIYFHTPTSYVPNLGDPCLLEQIRRLDITLMIGRDDPYLESNRVLSTALWEKGIWNALRVCPGHAHNFHDWREMLRNAPLPLP
ncbi:MAG TPA: alpha/beta hydrolase-fold protein [Longimicrobium sp.]|nr:alpha/beta hydrolase-fold protein [Longimicrobium sp.]